MESRLAAAAAVAAELAEDGLLPLLPPPPEALLPLDDDADAELVDALDFCLSSALPPAEDE